MSIATLQSGDRELTVLSAGIVFPLRGAWSARLEVDADEDEPLEAGPARLVLTADNDGAPVDLDGTIVEVDTTTCEGRATAILVAGKASIASLQLEAKTYQQAPLDVPVASIATDAVTDAGEVFDDDVAFVGIAVPRWHRVASTAAQVLDRLSQRFGVAWRMNDAGAVVFAIDEWLEADEDEAGLYLEGTENAQDRTIAGTVARASLRPGVVVRGRRIEEVHYLLDGTRLGVLLRWGEGTGAGGLRGDIEAATKRSMPLPAYSQVHAVTIRRQNADGTLDVEADDPSVGSVTSVEYYPGVVGCRLVISDGARALLAFLGGDETRPAICGFARFVQNPIAIENDYAVARVNDPVASGSFTFAAVSDGSGGIASITITYFPPFGAPQARVLSPLSPATINLSSVIQSGTPEVYLRATP